MLFSDVMKRSLRRLIPLLGLALAFSCTGYEKLDLADPVPVAALSAPPPGKPRADRVIVISIDGLRPDAIDAAGAETLKRLIGRGAYCAKAQTIRPSITLPSHTSMLTGLDYRRHGVAWNSYRTGYIVHPTVFSVASQAGKKSAMIFSKDKFHFLANPNCVSWIYGPPTPAKVPVSEDDCEVEELKRSLQAESGSLEATTRADMIGRAFAAAWPDPAVAADLHPFPRSGDARPSPGLDGAGYIEAVKHRQGDLDLLATRSTRETGSAGRPDRERGPRRLQPRSAIGGPIRTRRGERDDPVDLHRARSPPRGRSADHPHPSTPPPRRSPSLGLGAPEGSTARPSTRS
jgi:hypothetical protein